MMTNERRLRLAKELFTKWSMATVSKDDLRTLLESEAAARQDRDQWKAAAEEARREADRLQANSVCCAMREKAEADRDRLNAELEAARRRCGLLEEEADTYAKSCAMHTQDKHRILSEYAAKVNGLEAELKEAGRLFNEQLQKHQTQLQRAENAEAECERLRAENERMSELLAGSSQKGDDP